MDIIDLSKQQGRDQCMKNPTSRASEWACKEAEGVEPGSPAAAEVGHDRQPGRNLTPGSVRSYELGVWKVKKEIPVRVHCRRAPWSECGSLDRGS